jgi:POT family proton-dependent oligopeptide transporter
MHSETNTNWNSYLQSLTILLVSNTLERAVYYGIRGLIVLYMVGETFDMPREEAYAIYGILGVVLLFTKILGAVLGDLVLGNRFVSIAGNILQALGAFILCVPTLNMLYIGIGLVSLGSGLYGPNLFSQFGKLHLNKESKMDSGFTLLYLAINLGSFLGVLILGILGEKNMVYAFVACGFLSLLSAALLLLSKNKAIEEVGDAKKITLPKRLLMILLAIFISSIFWGIYEIGATQSFSILAELRDSLNETVPFSIFSSLNAYAVILFGIVGAVLWWLWRLNRFIKLGVGCIAGGLSFAVLLFIPEGGQTPGLVVFIISVLLLGLAEILISPTIYSVLTKYTNPKYLAIIFSLAFLPLSILYRLNSLLLDYSFETDSTGFLLKLSTFLLVVTGIGIIVLGFIFLKKKPAS